MCTHSRAVNFSAAAGGAARAPKGSFIEDAAL